MAIDNTDSFSGPYLPNGATLVFPFSFIALTAAEVVVMLRAVDGTETYPVGYSVTINPDGGGSINFSVAPVAGPELFILLDPVFTQPIAFENGSAWLAEPVNEVADRAAQRDIWLRGRLLRGISVPFGEDGVVLPPANQRAGRYLVGGALGDLLFSQGTGADAGLREDLAEDGAPLISVIQSGAGAIPESLEAYLRRSVWAESFGLSTSSTPSQNAAAFAAALAAAAATGGTVRFRGDYVTDTIVCPQKPAVVRIEGEGSLTQGTPNTPIMRAVIHPLWPAQGVRLVNADISGFTMIPHVGSARANTANVMLDISSFESSRFDVTYDDNPAATATHGRAYAAINGHAQWAPTYKNDIRLVLLEGASPSRGVWLHNNGTGNYLFNPNKNDIEVRGYGTGCDYIIDVLETTQTTVRNSLLEAGTPTTRGILAGNYMHTESNWFETLAVAIEYGIAGSTIANNCVSTGDQFSGANKIIIHSSITAPPRFDNPLPGAVTFENQSGVASTNYIDPTLSRQQPARPTLSSVITGATISEDHGSNFLRHRVDHHGRTTFQLKWLVTPTGTGRDIQRFTVPAGFEIESAFVSACQIGTAQPLPVAISLDVAGRDWEVWWPNTSIHVVSARVTYRGLPS